MTERYSPAEAKLVLARVAELQLARERVTVGMTREELVRIAVDAGLDAELLDQALAEIRASRVEYQVEETLTKTVVSCELMRPLGEDELVELSNRLAHAHGVDGGGWEKLATGKVWRAGSLELTIRKTAGGDLLRVEARRRWPSLALVLGVPAASGALALTVEILFAWKARIGLITWAVFLAALSIGWGLVFLARKQGSAGERLVALLERTVRRLPPVASNPPRALQEGD